MILDVFMFRYKLNKLSKSGFDILVLKKLCFQETYCILDVLWSNLFFSFVLHCSFVLSIKDDVDVFIDKLLNNWVEVVELFGSYAWNPWNFIEFDQNLPVTWKIWKIQIFVQLSDMICICHDKIIWNFNENWGESHTWWNLQPNNVLMQCKNPKQDLNCALILMFQLQ